MNGREVEKVGQAIFNVSLITTILIIGVMLMLRFNLIPF